MRLYNHLFVGLLALPALGLFAAACGGDDKDETVAATATRPAVAAAATSAPAAVATTAPAPAPAATATTAPPPPAPAATTAPPPPPPPAATTAPPPPAPPAPPAVSALSVSIVDFAFTPAQLTARVGSAVTVTARNTGQVSHTFSIIGGSSTGTLTPGASGTVTFTATQMGTMNFRCDIHNSMMGSISVTATGQAAPGGDGSNRAASNPPATNVDNSYNYGY